MSQFVVKNVVTESFTKHVPRDVNVRIWILDCRYSV